MKRFIFSILAAGLLAGCVAAGVQVKEEQLAQFERGKSTLPQVVATLGQPSSTSLLNDGSRIIVYSYVQSQARAATFIPIVGPLVGGADATSNMVALTFDKDGILRSYTSNSSQTGLGMGFAAGTTSQPAGALPQQAP